jgi:hypothetical protein
MTSSDPSDEFPVVESALGPWMQPPNREPGTREHPHASRPRRDLEDRASVDGQDDEGREHLYGHRTLDGQAHKPHYLGNPRRGRQARHVDDAGAERLE